MSADSLNNEKSNVKVQSEGYLIELIYNQKLNVDQAHEFVSLPDCGGNSLFMGSTRDTEKKSTGESFKIDGLWYEAYESMALKQMTRIAEQTLNDQVRRVYIAHRIGWVPVGEHSILIATSSPGRSECSEATLAVLNQVKQYVPIWKRGSDLNCQSCSCKPIEDSIWSNKSEAFWLHQTDN